MRKSLLLTIFFLLLSFSNAFAQNIDQSINLKQGFNFISFTVQPAITAPKLKQDNLSLIEDLFLYNSSAGSFLSVSEGTLTTISAGKGYILKAKTDGTLNVTGTSITTSPDLSLKTGFNLIGLSQTITSNTFSNIIRTYGIIKGIYKWSPTAGSFIQVIKDYNGTPQLIDSVDPQFKTGESYFINVFDNTTLSFSSNSINFIGGTIPTNTEIPTAVLSDLPTAEQKTGYGNIEGEISPTFSTSSSVNRIINIVSLSNIKVWVKNHPEINTVTDSNGKFILKNVPAAAKGSGHTIEYEKNEGEDVFKGVVKDVPVIEKMKIDLKPYIGPSVIKKTGAITGKIALSDGLSPLGAEIYIPAISGLIAKADEDGTFNILYIPEGTFNLVAYANGYEIYKTEIIISAGEIKSLNSIILNKKTIATLDSYIDGYIIDENSAPIANANLSLLSEDLKTDIGTSTSITGHYRFNNVPAGKYKIYVTKDQFIGLNTDETIITGQTKFINISLKKAQNFYNTYAMVFGKLMMKGTNIPLRNAIIVTSPPTQQYFTDFDGTFNFLLPAGSLNVYKIFYKKAGFIDFSSEISLKADESISIQDILLQPLTNDLIPATIDLNISTLTIKEGESLQLNPTVRDNIGNIITGQKVDWSVNNTNGFITLSGLFNAIKAGDIEITAKCAGITKIINIKIEASASVISQLKITSESIGFETGKVYKFNLVAISSDGKVTIIPASMASWEISPVNSNVIITEGSLISSAAYNGIVKATYNQQAASKLINIISAVADTTPPSISHIPPVLKPASMLELKCIVTDNKNVEKAILYFKKAGTAYENSPWSIIPMDRVITTENNYSNEYSYTIPASFITTDGIKYYIAANDMSQNKSYYPAEGELIPVTLLPTTSGYVSTIKGRVVVTGTNTPISDAQVIFSAGDGIIVKTDASGNFIINGQFTFGLYSLSSTKLGKIGEKSLEITASQYGTEITDITIEMEQPKLTKIEIEKTQDQIGMNQKYDLSKLSVTAYYDNNQSKTIIPKWLVDKGTIENLIYSPIQQIYTATFTAIYTESGINKITYLTLSVIYDNVKSLGQLSLSKTAETVLTSSMTYNLAQVTATAYYSDGSYKSITPTWTLVKGNGTISGTTYTLPTSAGTSTLVASYTESNATKTAELLLTSQQVVILPTVATPTISPTAGTYTAPQTLTISCSTSGATLKYTLDGSIPSATNGLTYSSPISVAQTSAIKVIAIKTGMNDSSIISASFIISTQPTNTQTITIDLGNNVTLEMVKIPAGTFQMGSPDNEIGRISDEGPVHTVNITNDFYIGKYEITQGQWKAIMNGNNPSSAKLGDNYPVESVTWNDCQNFINNLNTLYPYYGRFRLPSEAEWEYACKASTTTAYYWGTTINGDYCLYSDNSGNVLNPVGQKLPNSFGLYDMSGNVWEWCNDWYGNYSSTSSTNPSGPTSGTYRVYRSGGWSSGSDHCRSSKRFAGNPVGSGRSGGFRIAHPLVQTTSEKASAPSISPSGGTFNSAQQVIITSATSGATIKYTLDGSTPSATNGLTYTTPITISQTSTVKAIAIKTGMTNSDVVTSSYVIQSLVAWWKFDEGTGTTAFDSSGNNFTCAVQNTQWTDGVIGKCLSFNGSSTSVKGTANSKLSLTNLTLSAWIKSTGNGTNNPRIVAIGPAATSAQHYVMALDGGARVVAFGRESVLPLQPVNSTKAITNDNKWHQITVTFDGNIVKHYIDGILDKSTISNISPKQFTSAIIQIGFSDSGTDRFQGLIDDIKIYNYALPESEIINYYTANKPVKILNNIVLPSISSTTLTDNVYNLPQNVTAKYSDLTESTVSVQWYENNLLLSSNTITKSVPGSYIYTAKYAESGITAEVQFTLNVMQKIEPKILYTFNIDGNREIYTMSPDGSNKQRITTNTFNDSVIMQVININKLVFWSNRDGNNELYTMNLDGSELKRITTNTFDDSYSSLSPDGQKIVFQSNRNGLWEIFIMNVDGTNLKKITAGICPSYTNDGQKIIFSNSINSTKTGVFIINADGTNLTKLTNDSSPGLDYHPQISDDRSLIFFNSNRTSSNYQLFNMNTITNVPTQITFFVGNDSSRPVFYNNKLYFATFSSNNYEWICSMNIDGSDLNVLLGDQPLPLEKVKNPIFTPSAGTYYASQQISITSATPGSTIKYTTDGSEPSPTNGTIYSGAFTLNSSKTIKVIAYKEGMINSDVVSSEFNIIDVSTPKIIFSPSFDGNNQLYMINIDGTNKIRLTTNTYTDYLNTQILKHSKIVFWSNRNGNNEIYTCDLSGNNVTRLTTNSVDDMHPSFSPDGSQIIFQTIRNGTWDIYMMNADGTNQRKITAGTCPSFSEDGTKIIFSNSTATGSEIYTANADGSNISQITNDSYSKYHCQYSNDNSVIYYNCYQNGPNYQIYSINLATKFITKLTNINANCTRHYVYNDKIIFQTSDLKQYLYIMNKDGSNLQIIAADPPITEKVQTPVISVASGTYSRAQQILVTCSTADSIIKYTTDGSTPSATNGMTYNSAITFAENTTLKVVAIKTNMTDSDLASATYTINIPPQTLSLDLGDSVMLEMVKIPAGTFQMGDVGVTDAVPVHTVTILKDYYIGKSEITQAQWLKIFGSWPGTAPSATYAVGNDYPAYSVSWDDICSTGGFLEKINILKPNSYGAFRLPTEAEWEFACRGNTTTAFYWGDTINNDYCWYNSNSGGKTHRVGTTLAGLNSANSFGLFDMSGNVFEWCSDWYGTYSSDSVTDPTGAASGTKRVLRGGTWVNAAIYNRSGARHFDLPTYRSAGVGFRVVLPISQ